MKKNERIMKILLHNWMLMFCFVFSIYVGVFHVASAASSHEYENKKNNNFGVIEQIEFRDVSVGDALRILSEQSDLNLIASKNAADVHITMFLRKVTPMQVIDAISKTYNLWYRKDLGSKIVRIYTVQEYRLEQVEFNNEITKIFTMKNARNALDFADTINNLYGERVQLSFGESQDELRNEIQERFTRFELIGEGGGGAGVGSNQDNRGSSRNFNDNFSGSRRGRRSLRESNSEFSDMMRSSTSVLDKKTKDGDAPGILLGNMEKSRSFLDKAIQHQVPIFVGVIKRQNRVLVRTRDSDAMKAINHLFKQLDKNSTMLLLEVRVLQIELGDGFNSLFDFKMKNGNAQLSTLNAHPEGVDPTNFIHGALRASAATFEPAMLASIVSDNFEARIELLEKEKRITELSTQMLMTTNQEVSRIFVGQSRPITTGFTSTQAANIGSPGVGGAVITQPIIVPETEMRPIGTTLLLTPNINADGTVSIRLLVEQSTFLEKAATIPVPVASNVGLAEAQVDVVNERSFSGTVVAQNETSVAIGGLITEASRDNEDKVPWVGDIPFLGFFFKEMDKKRSRQELVVILKPHIVSAPEQAEVISDRFLHENSVHPKAVDANATLDIYKNNRRDIRGYQLQEPYKLYDQQDRFDAFHKKGDLSRQRKLKKVQATSSQHLYVKLTKYAAQAVRLPENERAGEDGITPVTLTYRRSVNLFYDERIKVIPVASWRRGGVYVTAFEVRNTSDKKVWLDYKNIKGHWIASTVEQVTLEPRRQMGDSCYMYLISAGPFDDIYSRLQLSKRTGDGERWFQ